MTTIPIGQLTGASLLIGIALMFTGTASGSTGGGIKLTTFSILPASIVSTILGRPHTEAFGRRVSEVIVYRALSVALLSVALVFGMTLLLQITTRSDDILPIAFETVSAFGTVGDSTGITPTLPGYLAGRAHRHYVRRTPRAAHLRPRPRGAYPGAVTVRPALETIRIG